MEYIVPKIEDMTAGRKYEAKFTLCSVDGNEERWSEFEVAGNGTFVTYGSLDKFDEWAKDKLRIKV